MNLNEFKKILEEMNDRSEAFHLVKYEMQKRGHWKNKPRGIPQNKETLNRSFTAANMQTLNKRQVKVNSFGDVEYE